MKVHLLVAAALLVTIPGLSGSQGVFEPATAVEFVDPVISPLVVSGGTVVLRVEVDAAGGVTGVEAVRPVAALTEPAVAAVRQWRFTPARLGGKPLKSTTTVAVHVAIVRSEPIRH